MSSAALFLEETQTFADRVRELALPAVGSYYWYHTVDLPLGLNLESLRRGSGIECYCSTVDDLSAEKAGVLEGFDLVFVGDVFVRLEACLVEMLIKLGFATVDHAGVLRQGDYRINRLVFHARTQSR